MNYEKIYNQLCERSKSRKWEKFKYEKHHIVPKSMGGSNRKDNLAILTPREHALAHLLLVKFLTGEHKAKMVYALQALGLRRNDRRAHLPSREYALLREAYARMRQEPEYRAWRSEMSKKQWTPERRAAQSALTKQQWAEPNSAKRQSFSSDEYRQLKSQQMKERWGDPEYQKFISESATEQWKDPNKRPRR